MSIIQNLRKSLVRNWRPVCSAVGDAISGAEFAPFPSPLPPACGGDGPVCSRLAPLDLVRPSVVRTASSVFGLVNFLSLSFAVPQFKLVTHKSSLQLPSEHSGPVFTPSNAARSSPFHPPLAGGGCGRLGYFSAGRCFEARSLWGLFIYLFIFLPVRLPSEIQKLPPDPPVRGFPGVWKLLY